MTDIFAHPVSFRDEVDFSQASGMTLPDSVVTNAMCSSGMALVRSKLASESKSYRIPWEAWRVHDAYTTVLPATSSSDDLGLYAGTHGTNSPEIKTYDVKTVGATTLYARCTFELPAEYDAAQTLTLRAKAGMETTVADTSCTLDFTVYKSNSEGGIGSDLCATSATSINSLTYANKDFTITATGLAAGDVLDIRMAVAVNDGAGATAVTAAIGWVGFVATVRG